MFKVLKISVLLNILLFNFSFAQNQTQKPWAYWWWMGSAVNEQDIKTNLENYAKAGFGGMHIIPIYGVKDQVQNNIDFLSPKWISILKYTVKEASNLGLGIDMTLGTGWPFGGPQIDKKFAAKKISFVADSIVIGLTNQKVKRAAPGGEGLVIDHFDKNAINHYFAKFDSVFKAENIPIRAFYNDSYEVYDANWTNDFFEKFKSLRSYDLKNHISILNLKVAETDLEKRIWADYHKTISELLLHEFTIPYANFSGKFNKLSRNESHGSPANVLDLYAASDIPETEFFGSRPFDISGYRQDANYEPSRFGIPTSVVLKLASSAANVSNKSLVSSETSTWLGNHFNVALSQIKPIIDFSFLYGVNHVFYHGLPYSPPNEPFPGWLFYASTNYNQNSHFWNELPLLNKYIENAQTLLQKSKPDNEILILLPFSDLWHSVGRKGKTHPIDVHSLSSSGLFSSELMDVIAKIEKEGYQYDFISDKQINELAFKNGQLITKLGEKYKALVIPKTSFFELETLISIENLKQKGLKNIFFINSLPTKVAGFHDYEKRQIAFDKALKSLSSSITNDLISSLKNTEIKQEMLTKEGLTFIRKKINNKTLYFIANQSNIEINKWINLANTLFQFKAYDPLLGKEFNILNRLNSKKNTEIFINLASGKSMFLMETSLVSKPFIASKTKPKTNIELNGKWQIEFTKGQPILPKKYVSSTLESWTKAPDTMAQYYNGYAKYSLTFEFSPQTNTNYTLDLGDVRETAKVWLNGKEIGTAWCLPFQLNIPKDLLKHKNKIEIEVRNLSANQIRLLDKNQVNWKKFEDINFVDIQYKPFDASKWPAVQSGLLGPVRIISQ